MENTLDTHLNHNKLLVCCDSSHCVEAVDTKVPPEVPMVSLCVSFLFRFHQNLTCADPDINTPTGH